ncbi:hypothetical protein FBY33_0799 [Arthrobacter sp. SLBN-112]|nr:hypothetical protein [Arthrobacter sp. SLBN-112]TQJ38797.1 hypothetical protein FBY33_0799 [Arthrobacter sp. SLBN-112]
MHWAAFAVTGAFAGRDDGDGEVSAVVEPSVEGALLGTVRLQLTVWEQWA